MYRQKKVRGNWKACLRRQELKWKGEKNATVGIHGETQDEQQAAKKQAL